MLSWLPRFFFLIAVVLSVVVLTKATIKTEIDVFDANTEIFFQRIVYGNDGFSYTDNSINRPYPAIIDLKRFKEPDFLNGAFYYGEENREIGARIILRDFDGNIQEVIKYNEEFYDEKDVLVRGDWPEGRGGVKSKTKKLYVLIKDGDKLTDGTLEAKIIMQNR